MNFKHNNKQCQQSSHREEDEGVWAECMLNIDKGGCTQAHIRHLLCLRWRSRRGWQLPTAMPADWNGKGPGNSWEGWIVSTCHTLYSEPRSKMRHNGEGRAERGVRIRVGYEPPGQTGLHMWRCVRRSRACRTRQAFDIEVNVPHSMQIYHLVIWEGATTNTVRPGLTPNAPFVSCRVNIPVVCLMPIDKKELDFFFFFNNTFTNVGLLVVAACYENQLEWMLAWTYTN